MYNRTWNLLLCSIQGEPTLRLSWLNNAEGKVFFSSFVGTDDYGKF